MDIAEFLITERIALDIRARDKTACLGEAARLLARSLPSPSAEAIEAALLARERLGSTGLGAGFALPHARIDTLDAHCGLFMRLSRPIAFDSIDGKPVDLLFVLLSPPETVTPHVSALAAISRRFRDAALVTKLRKAKAAADVLVLLTGI